MASMVSFLSSLLMLYNAHMIHVFSLTECNTTGTIGRNMTSIAENLGARRGEMEKAELFHHQE